MKRKVLKITKNKLLQEIVEETKPIEHKKESQNKFLEMMSLAFELGFSISLPIAGGALLGRYLDNRFQSNPRLTLSLIFFGTFLGFARIFTIMKESEKERNI